MPRQPVGRDARVKPSFVGTRRAGKSCSGEGSAHIDMAHINTFHIYVGFIYMYTMFVQMFTLFDSPFHVMLIGFDMKQLWTLLNTHQLLYINKNDLDDAPLSTKFVDCTLRGCRYRAESIACSARDYRWHQGNQ